jgi:uracil-DNA glycosylase family 4
MLNIGGIQARILREACDINGGAMDKRSQIRKLFSNFECRDAEFFKYDITHNKLDSRVQFKCGYEGKGQCEVNPKKQPIWSPAFGDENAKVMLVGEAPSTTDGVGPHLGGLFADWDPWKFRDLFARELGYMPYFTDLVKCGPENARNKNVIRRRAKYCGKKFLIEEIRIINPDLIYCVGRESYSWLRVYHEEHGLVNKNGKRIELQQIIHYSKQAGLPLTIADKEMIWRWQLGLDKNLSLSSLSFFQSQRDRSESVG